MLGTQRNPEAIDSDKRLLWCYGAIAMTNLSFKALWRWNNAGKMIVYPKLPYKCSIDGANASDDKETEKNFSMCAISKKYVFKFFLLHVSVSRMDS